MCVCEGEVKGAIKKGLCVCKCVCVCARACVSVCVCMSKDAIPRLWRSLQRQPQSADADSPRVHDWQLGGRLYTHSEKE